MKHQQLIIYFVRLDTFTVPESLALILRSVNSLMAMNIIELLVKLYAEEKSSKKITFRL